MEEDFTFFLLNYPNLNVDIILYYEIVLLPYRQRLYNKINLLIIDYVLSNKKGNINNVIRPLYIHKPTIFFHALYTNTPHNSLIKLLLKYQPDHYVYNKYSLLTAIKLRDMSLIKLLLPYTDIDFKIKDTTPYLYTISNFSNDSPIYILMEYHKYNKYGIQILMYKTILPTDTIQYIKSYLI